MKKNGFMVRMPWNFLRLTVLVAALLTAAFIFLRPDIGLPLFWSIVIPLLPGLFFIAPGLWRNICPMATLNQLPKRFGFARNLPLSEGLTGYSFAISILLLLGFVSCRKWLFDASGAATAGLAVFGLVSAFIGGVLFKGMSGWCSTFCPILPVERLYGQTPFAVVPNTSCSSCSGCTKNCYDLNPNDAFLADQYDADPHYVGPRRVFVGLFPGFILAFFTVPPTMSIGGLYLHFVLYCAVSLSIFVVLDTFLKLPRNRLAILFGATALNTYYWYASAGFFAKLSLLTGQWEVPSFAPWSIRLSLLGLTAAWLVRSFIRENKFMGALHAPFKRK